MLLSDLEEASLVLLERNQFEGNMLKCNSLETKYKILLQAFSVCFLPGGKNYVFSKDLFCKLSNTVFSD
ncbi:hypothetical protein BpHYR1_010637 [Brachionus plicatilis]|uniref:Uncharacterized protein n=1 Tax=Brachionus plicatilis TaxID=10195 RepID=A0A3M7S759_BRAPC|nr:hypothetical protein BpHYR1_010637 [Brachionus plicatilis]